MAPQPVRIVLIDDHTMFRQGLRALLSHRGGIEVVGDCPTGEGAIALLGDQEPDVVVTQIDMDLKVAEDVLGRVREASPNSRLVVLTVFDNLHYVQALSRLGIDAYIHKSSSEEELVATVEALAREPQGGDTVVSVPRGSLERMGDGPLGELTDRETEVLVHAARGLSNRQIATEMHLAESTVKRHLANIYEKVGVSSRTEAVRMALVEQWIGLPEIVRESPSADGFGLDGHPGSADGRGTQG
jgi:DNA-binding NarL/FixJ family response regulator